MNGVRLRYWILAVLVGLPSLPAETAPRQAKRATVAVDLVGVDPMTKKFRNALKARIASDPQLQLIDNVRSADLRLSSRTKIDWDVLSGRMVMIYIVTAATRRSSYRISGVCFENDPAKCARDLVRRSKHVLLNL